MKPQCGNIRLQVCTAWASPVAQLVTNLPAMQETLVQFLGWQDPWRRDRLPTPVFLGFPVAQMVENLPAMQETWVDPWFGKIPWRREWLPTLVVLPGDFHGQRSLTGYTVHGVTKSQT